MTPLTDDLIKANKGDFEGLWSSWVAPQIKKGRWNVSGLIIEDGATLKATEEALERDLSKFCTQSGGSLSTSASSSKMYKGKSFVCNSKSGEFLGLFETRLYDVLAIYFQTPKMKAAEEMDRAEFELSLKANGPTGWVTTNRGRYKFIRIGTLKSRDKIEVNKIPIERISSVKFIRGSSYDVEVVARDGSSFVVNSVEYIRRPSYSESRGFGVDGMPFVLVDQDTGMFYQDVFDGSAYGKLGRYRLDERVEKIELDSEEMWLNKYGGELFDGWGYGLLGESDIDIDKLESLISKFENNDPKNLIPAAKRRLAAMIEEESRAKIEVERRNALWEAERKKVLEKKQIGDQVCMETQSTMNKATGIVILGQPDYKRIDGKTKLVGFVEGLNSVSKKIQIRISGINFSGNGENISLDSFSNFKGGSKLALNSLIWDSTYDWNLCN